MESTITLMIMISNYETLEWLFINNEVHLKILLCVHKFVNESSQRNCDRINLFCMFILRASGDSCLSDYPTTCTVT